MVVFLKQSKETAMIARRRSVKKKKKKKKRACTHSRRFDHVNTRFQTNAASLISVFSRFGVLWLACSPFHFEAGEFSFSCASNAIWKFGVK